MRPEHSSLPRCLLYIFQCETVPEAKGLFELHAQLNFTLECEMKPTLEYPSNREFIVLHTWIVVPSVSYQYKLEGFCVEGSLKSEKAALRLSLSLNRFWVSSQLGTHLDQLFLE